MRFFIASLLVLSACGKTNLDYCGFSSCGGDGGGRADGGTCSGLDETSCQANAACRVESCPTCHGATTFVGCVDKSASELYACPARACLSCHDLDQASCTADSSCQVANCPDCNGGTSYNGCYDIGAKVACALDCIAPPTCASENEGTCDADPNCGAIICDGCGNQHDFVGCFDQNSPPPIHCDLRQCAQSCEALGPTSCAATSGCTTVNCECNDRTVFAGCYTLGNPQPSCPSECQPPSCASLDQTACVGRIDCFAVYHQGAFVECTDHS